MDREPEQYAFIKFFRDIIELGSEVYENMDVQEGIERNKERKFFPWSFFFLVYAITLCAFCIAWPEISVCLLKEEIGGIFVLYFRIVVFAIGFICVLLGVILIMEKLHWDSMNVQLFYYECLYMSILFGGPVIASIVLFRNWFGFKFRRKESFEYLVYIFSINLSMMLYYLLFGAYITRSIIEMQNVDVQASAEFSLLMIVFLMEMEFANFFFRKLARRQQYIEFEKEICRSIDEELHPLLRECFEEDIEHDQNCLRRLPKIMALSLLVLVGAVTLLFGDAIISTDREALVSAISFITLVMLLFDKRKEWTAEK